jgi:hypothetical protein
MQNGAIDFGVKILQLRRYRYVIVCSQSAAIIPEAGA